MPDSPPWTTRVVLYAQSLSFGYCTRIADVSSVCCAEVQKVAKSERVERGSGPTLVHCCQDYLSRSLCDCSNGIVFARKFLHGRIGPFLDLSVHGVPPKPRRDSLILELQPYPN